jgi:Na+/melibiose symporter-like transporter
MRALWGVLVRHRDYRFLLAAGLVSMAGDWVLSVGLVYYVYAVTGSTVASATMLLAAFLPQMLLGSVAGVFVDRWDRRRTMIGANLLMALGLLPLLAFDGAGQVWIAYVVVLFVGAVEQFVIPAQAALVPQLVADGDLVTANALNGQTRNVARLAGAGLGAVAVGVGGVALVAVLDAVTYLVAAGLLVLIASATDRPASDLVGAPPRSLLAEWRSGLALAAHEPTLRVLFVMAGISSVGEGVMGTLFAPFVRDVLHGGGSAYGVILGAQAVGGIAAGFAAAIVAHRYPPQRLLGWGALFVGVIDLLLFLYPLAYATVWPAVVCMVAVGLPAALAVVGQTTLLQRTSSTSHRGRVFGALSAVQGVALLAGTLLAGVLGDVLGIVPVIAVQGAGYAVAGLIVLAHLPGARRRPAPIGQPAAA